MLKIEICTRARGELLDIHPYIELMLGTFGGWGAYAYTSTCTCEVHICTKHTCTCTQITFMIGGHDTVVVELPDERVGHGGRSRHRVDAHRYCLHAHAAQCGNHGLRHA